MTTTPPQDARSRRWAFVATQLNLTPRESDILLLLYDAKGVKQIALVLCISVHTARWHIRNIYGKLNVRDRVELLRCVFSELEKFREMEGA